MGSSSQTSTNTLKNAKKSTLEFIPKVAIKVRPTQHTAAFTDRVLVEFGFTREIVGFFDKVEVSDGFFVGDLVLSKFDLDLQEDEMLYLNVQSDNPTHRPDRINVVWLTRVQRSATLELEMGDNSFQVRTINEDRTEIGEWCESNPYARLTDINEKYNK